MAWFSFHGGHSGQYCRHAKGALRAVVERAVDAGFSTYGLAEHCPRYESADLFPDEQDLGVAGLAAQFEAYVVEARALQHEFADRIELLVGFETEALPSADWAQRMRGLRVAHDFDFIIGSVHTVESIPVDLDVATTDRVMKQVGGWEALCIAYFEQVAELVTLLQPEVAGHLDLVRRFRGADVEFSSAVWLSIENALSAVKKAGALMEVNAAPVRRDFGPVYPSLPILRRALAMGIPVTLGDDSHGPQDVGGGLDACMAAISAAGYQHVHALTRREGKIERQAFGINAVRPAG